MSLRAILRLARLRQPRSHRDCQQELLKLFYVPSVSIRCDRVTRQVLDLTTSGYMGKDKDGSETATTIQARLPLREAVGGEQTVGDVLDVVVDTNTHGFASRDRG